MLTGVSPQSVRKVRPESYTIFLKKLITEEQDHEFLM